MSLATISHKKKWDDTLHNPNALNSPAKEIKDLDIGLIKKGNASLVLSGTNSYLGDTIVREGTLKLTQGASLASNVFIEKQTLLEITPQNTQSRIKTSTILEQNLYNQGSLNLGSNSIANLEIKGTYFQDKNANLKLFFTDKENSTLQAQDYNIEQGASLTLTPMLSQIPQDSDKIVLDFKGLESKLDRFEVKLSQSLVWDLSLQNDKKTLAVKLSDTAYDTQANAKLGRALRSIYNDRIFLNSNPNYEAFFKELNLLSSLSTQTYFNTINSTINADYLEHNQRLLKLQNKLDLENILIFSQNKDDFINLSPNYAYENGANYHGFSSGTKMQALKHISDIAQIAGFFNYAHTQSSFKLSTLKTHSLSAGLSVNYDLEFVDFFAGTSFSFNDNDFSRTLLTSQANPLKSNYNALIGSVYAGYSKNFVLDDLFSQAPKLNLSPMAFINYNLFKQDEFSENQALFANSYKANTLSNANLNLGATLSYELQKLKNSSIKLDFFAFYERLLTSSVVKNQAFISDYTSATLTHKFKADKDFFKLGVKQDFAFKNFLFSLGADTQLSKNTNNLSTYIKLNYIF